MEMRRVEVIINGEERTNIQEGVRLLTNTEIFKRFGGE
jgi:hypothetical protein